MKRTASAPGKIILSGEYAVVFGFPGVAVPAPVGVTAIYTEDLGQPDLQIIWEDAHPKWLEYIEKIIERCQAENDHLYGTLEIEADVPLGKGMGSSTAVIISVCRALLGDDCEVIARSVEDELNPGNSGIDFATIWYNSPIEFRKGEEPKIIRLEKDLLENTELIDTGAPNEQTHELVAWMNDHLDKIEPTLHTIGRCSERIIAGQDIKQIVKDHHRAQVELGVVPEEVRELITKIEQDGGAAKVIGAGGRTGGGGMVLVFY